MSQTIKILISLVIGGCIGATVVHFYDLHPIGTAMTDDPASQGVSGPWSTMTPNRAYDHRSTVQWLEDNAELAKQEAWLAKNRPKEWLAKHPGETP